LVIILDCQLGLASVDLTNKQIRTTVVKII
jgi:hypothetical protein